MKLNKLFLVILSLTLFGSAFVQTIEGSAATQSFQDVPTSYYAHKEITDLVNRGVINGYSDGTFKPTKQVTRAEFATFVARALDFPSATSSFKDVPKTSALYDGVSKANKSGIIKGFSNSTFKPNLAVSRQDMAVMIDRAMQLKGKYTQSKALNFSDKSKVGAYAKTSVERLYNYNVMGAFSGTQFQPTTIGTRAETAKFIYNMLFVLEGGKIVAPTTPVSSSEIESIKKKDPLKLTYDEVVKAYGPYVILVRNDIFNRNEGIVEWDIWKTYFDSHVNPAIEYKWSSSIIKTPDEWLEESKSGFLGKNFGEVNGSYPNYELIAVNGVPFMNSELFTGNNMNIYQEAIRSYGDIYPTPPKSSSQFKIDLHYKKADFAVYTKESVGIGKQVILPYTKENKALMVDVIAAFTKTTQIKVSANKISFNGNTLSFKNGSTEVTVNGETKTLSVSPEMKNGVQMLPIRETAKLIGLETRVMIYGAAQRIEILNYTEEYSEVYK
jgi:hypothetical protein